jgi:hypothetical protein
MDKPRLYLNPDCPRFATTPARPDGSFDHEKFGHLLQMQEKGGVTLDQFVKVMQETEMEDTPLIRARESVLAGVEAEGFETHPTNWEAMPEEYRAMWVVVGA